MTLHVTIERMQPLAGRVCLGSSEPVCFMGWLELIGALSDLVGADRASKEADRDA